MSESRKPLRAPDRRLVMPRRPDAFDRKLAAYRKVRAMSVPDPISPQCEVRLHPACRGEAWDLLKEEPAPCVCSCHRHPTRRYGASR